ncbi:hypothetical protein RM704_02045 [Streptomyces sp. DSM 3412]|uniref:Uncharacterized protein n=1 Tax=Streptomyces gottesmaniae TaxID=3075518 RepID=A0ABU2YPP7_9ACTN|nr:hypothetical protein [Streptomyces sp. DSM 3412]MDT0566270.1 hypothetical protein [Streptomyces sp. DSM 3412]
MGLPIDRDEVEEALETASLAPPRAMARLKPLSGVTDSCDLAVKLWTERPAHTDVEAVVRRYVSLLRAGRIPEADQLIDVEIT